MSVTTEDGSEKSSSNALHPKEMGELIPKRLFKFFIFKSYLLDDTKKKFDVRFDDAITC